MLKTKQSGFTLVETLVAITILLLVIVGPMTISSNAAKSTTYSSDQVIAFFLAQEGAELVQAYRDDYFLEYLDDVISGASSPIDPWDEFRNSGNALGTCFGASGCGLELQTSGFGTVVNCGSSSCRLYLDTNTVTKRSRYTHQNPTNTYEQTPYTRTIRIEQIPGQEEVRVISTVTWRSGNLLNEQSARVETYLLNTYGN